MTSDNTVFDDKTPDSNAPDEKVTPPHSPAENLILNTLVGDNKKFKTVEDLAKAKLESDTFINRLQEEAKELRKDLDTRLRTEEAIEALKKPREHQAPEDKEPVDIKKLVTDTLDQVERDKIAIGNVRQANTHLIDKLGGKKEAEAFLLKKSEELGVPVDWFKDMAARSPKALYNTLGVDAPVVVPARGMTQGDVNTEALNNINPPALKGSKAEYEALRKTNPSQYWSTPVQKEIFEATKKGLYK